MSKPALNIIGLTQGANIDVFLNLLECLRGAGAGVARAGAVVSFARHFLTSRTVLEKGQHLSYVKEWEVVADARDRAPDLTSLRERERSLSPSAVWSAIVGDRRLIYGPLSKFTQDYRVPFSDDQLWAIAQTFLEHFDALLDEVRPDVVLGFTPVTFGELLALEVAHARGIPNLQLHSSRVRNYFAFHDAVRGTSRHFLSLLEAGRFDDETITDARQVVAEAREKGLLYEGVNLTLRKGRTFHLLQALRSLPSALVHEFARRRNPVMARDHHDPGHIAPWFYQHLHQPMRARRVSNYLASHPRAVAAHDLNGFGSYCFFPMHSEPEVSLQVLGRPYHKNQIELLRNIGASLPAGMRLVFKEHPRSHGLRPVSYYRQLFEVPNLYVVPIETPSMAIVRHADLVTVISGTIGFEAAMAGKPVLMLGHPKYAALAGSMIQPCYDLFDLPRSIRELLDGYRYDEEALVQFVAALISGSVGIDVYSVLLGKAGRYSEAREGLSEEQKRQEDYRKLTQYTLSRISGISCECQPLVSQ